MSTSQGSSVREGHRRHARGAALSSPACSTLSVVIPVYNEAATVAETVARVRASQCADEIILVDDGSTDCTPAALRQLWKEIDICLLRHEKNCGKGAALRTGFANATSDIVIVQDADLEYNPADYEKLIEPIVRGDADVVYGSRFLGKKYKSGMHWLTWLANRLITWFFNRVYRQNLTDVETCYKAIRREKLQQVLPRLSEDRFGIEIELTARLAQLPGIRIVERPISYSARTHADGKKIGWRDGVRALCCIFKYR